MAQVLVEFGADIGNLDQYSEQDINNINYAKKTLIYKLGKLEKEHINKSLEFMESLNEHDLGRLSQTGLLTAPVSKRLIGLFLFEPELQLKKAREYSAEANNN